MKCACRVVCRTDCCSFLSAAEQKQLREEQVCFSLSVTVHRSQSECSVGAVRPGPLTQGRLQPTAGLISASQWRLPSQGRVELTAKQDRNCRKKRGLFSSLSWRSKDLQSPWGGAEHLKAKKGVHMLLTARSSEVTTPVFARKVRRSREPWTSVHIGSSY